MTSSINNLLNKIYAIVATNCNEAKDATERYPYFATLAIGTIFALGLVLKINYDHAKCIEKKNQEVLKNIKQIKDGNLAKAKEINSILSHLKNKCG